MKQSSPKLCIVCHQNVATVPDRNRPGRPVKRICQSCHEERLRGDLKRLYGLYRRE